MLQEKKLRKKIFKAITDIYKIRKKGCKFYPGVSEIPYAGRIYDEKEIISLVDSSLDFWLTQGRYSNEFERNFKKYLNVKNCLLTNSGSSANLLCLSSLTSHKLKTRQLLPGDEVITTACAFPTTVNPIIQNKFIPVFIDINKETYNIQADKIEKSLSKKTKAIFLAHTMGNPFDIEEAMRVADKYGLWVIEDNCDALGSKYNSKYTGTFGHMASFSFYPAHHITMGEGGAVLTNDALLNRIIMSYRDWGRDCWCQAGHDNTCGKRFAQKFGSLPFGYDHKYVYSQIGYNLKVTDMQAAIGVAQLEKLPGFTEARIRNFNLIYSGLKKYERYFILPQAAKNSEPSWFGFPLLVKSSAQFTRADIVLHLEKNKIATRMLFGGNLTKQPAYQGVKFRIAGDLRNTDLVMNNLFWIGVYPGISKVHISYIICVFEKFIKQYRGL
ncbi:MAG: lipopolysaccharide biosynthesis protein RfbH [Elusimicrobia bacterium CG1_02_37_114]|nr:MAG: lipopolysaccharide biosynthesis protein RfbH [Elusimicrobia bacterium CG1_02_37_114]